MFVRIWTFSPRPENAARYEEFARQVAMPMVRNQPGCLGVELFRRSDGATGKAEYVMISRWESREILQAALNSTAWKEEVQLFLEQDFGGENGSAQHYDPVV
jgi:heme-degrading monooxygenase HmoA